jgi:hypothetical protein
MPKLRSDNPGAPEQSKRSKPRVNLYKNPDGSYDTSSLSDEDKARLFGGAPGATPEPGAAPGPAPATEAAPPVEPIDPAVIGLALNLLTSIEAAVVGQKLGIPQDRCFAALQPRPPLDQMITGTAAKVANKYGASLGPYADEIALVALIATWQISAFTELRSIAADLAANRPAPPPPNADAGKHASPPKSTPDAPPAPKETPKEPKPAPAPSNVVPIDLLIGAHAATGPQIGGGF